MDYVVMQTMDVGDLVFWQQMAVGVLVMLLVVVFGMFVGLANHLVRAAASADSAYRELYTIRGYLEEVGEDGIHGVIKNLRRELKSRKRRRADRPLEDESAAVAKD